MYTGGAIYIDMATNLVPVEFQRHLNTHETLAATAEFERMCLDAGVIAQEYLSDNGSAFTSKKYMAHLRQFSQISRFAGVGAHHHNVCGRAGNPNYHEYRPDHDAACSHTLA